MYVLCHATGTSQSDSIHQAAGSAISRLRADGALCCASPRPEHSNRIRFVSQRQVLAHHCQIVSGAKPLMKHCEALMH